MALFDPDRYFSSICSIDVEWDLVRQGVKLALIDIDNTIRRRDNDEVPASVIAWMNKAHEKGVELCLLSNNFHQNAPDLASELGLPIVAKALKPLPMGYRRALKKMGCRASEAVMIGDQLFTDVVGAHLVGMKAYLVQPLVEADLKHTLVVRKFEDVFIGNAVPERGVCADVD